MPPSGSRPTLTPPGPSSGAHGGLAQAMAEAVQWHQTGKFDKAEKAYRQILASRPNQPDALNMLGVLLLQKGDAAGAIEFLKASVRLDPNPDARSNLALALSSAGAYDDAMAQYNSVLQAVPGHGQALFGLGRTLRLAGRPAESIAPLRAAAAAAPGIGDVHYQLGMSFRALGHLAEATHELTEAVRLAPGRPWHHMELASLSIETKDLQTAVAAMKEALRLSPDDPALVSTFVDLVRFISFHGLDPEMVEMIARAFETNDVAVHLLDKPLLSLLEHDPAVARLLDLAVGTGGADAIGAAWRDGSLGVLTDNAAFRSVVARTIPTHPGFETLLTHMRKVIAEDIAKGGALARAPLAFASALARQCHNSEFLYALADGEDATADTLTAALASALKGKPKTDARTLSLIAGAGFYRPLHTVAGAEALAKLTRRVGEPILAGLIADYVAAPLAEREIVPTIPAVTPIEDDVSRKVQAQYEESPYPRWFDAPSARIDPIGIYLRNAFPHLQAPAFLDNPERVLIGGCGSGHHAFVVARQMPKARILAVDLSRASLAHAIRWQRKLGIDNVEFVHGDILKLGVLSQRFQFVESFGVLHHMKDPLAGWRVLVGLTEPGGLMHIGLYSELARRIVVESRAYIAEHGYADTPADIRRFRHAIRAMPDGTYLKDANVCNREFYSVSSLRDLLFHVQEHRYTVPMIRDQAAELGLEFVGFASLDPGIEEAYRVRFPDDPTRTNLKNWERFEEEHPRTFRNTYDMWFRKPA